MVIDVLTTDGSPLGVTESTIWGDPHRVGVGGAELALLTMCSLWQQAGHTVRLYNSPWKAGASCFEQRPVGDFKPDENRDVLVVFRSPNPKAIIAKGLKVWWSCDQYTIGDYRAFAQHMQKIVCISPHHAEYFAATYGISNAIVIDLPVRLAEIPECEKVPNHLIFTSVPDRGLQHLWRIYPKIQQYIPDLTLTITSDYRLWGAGELNMQHRGRWVVYEGVDFIGAVSRQRYLTELARADLMVYPCEYPELFCISVAEAQCAGVPCITPTIGALATTNLGHLFYLDATDPRNDHAFIERAVEVLSNRRELEANRQLIRQFARERFAPERILSLWDKHVFEDQS